MTYSGKIDLHIHTDVSDGTDSPINLIGQVKNAGISLFSVTDHDATKGCAAICDNLKKGDPSFIFGVEFSTSDNEGKYHVLGYGYDVQSPSIKELVATGHSFRIEKLKTRLAFLKKECGICFPEEEVERLCTLNNPGKPHIGNIMVKYGYANTKEEAIALYINKCTIKDYYIRPETAITAIIKAGGIPVLAHPTYGRGDELIMGDQMDKRLARLIGYGLSGVEAFYSGFSTTMQREILGFAEKYRLYVTAGSDYHGENKMVALGDTNLQVVNGYPKGLLRFLDDVRVITPKR